jgi:hypothetical protein
MGYSYNETLCTLEANRIVKLEKFVPSLSWWINFPIKNVKLIRPLARLRKSLRKHGLKQTILRTRKLWKDKNIPI